MTNIFDRLAAGSQATQENDVQNWNQMVGSAPADKFGSAATQAIQQVSPDEYYQHSQPGVGGTDPFGAMSSEHRGGLLGSIMNALGSKGVSPQAAQQGSGVSSLDPSKMSSGDLAQMAQWLQKNHPEVLGQVAQQHQSNPSVLGSLLGNKALQALAVGLGAKILMDHHSG